MDWKTHLEIVELSRENYRKACLVAQNADKFLLSMRLGTASILTIMPENCHYQCSSNKPGISGLPSRKGLM